MTKLADLTCLGKCTNLNEVSCSGVYAGDTSADDSKLFICEQYALVDLLHGLKMPCSCGRTRHPWDLDSVIRV